MILPIEKWIAEQNYTEEVTDLLNEGIISYKAGAYRAGLLFSYLGFEKIIKNRLFEARRPDNLQEAAWSSIQKNLNDDHRWEETVFDTVTVYAKTPIFLQDNKKREEIKRHLTYWRDRRNDAAHAKKNEITNAHVETLWTFMQNNLPLLVVRGSRNAIIEDLKQHFDRRYTPKGTDFSYIIQQIKHSLHEEDLISFYKEIESSIFKGVLPIDSDDEINKFWDEIIKLKEPFSSQLVKYLKSDEGANVFHSFIEEYTERIILFSDDRQFIYNLWYEKIENFRDPYKLISVLLRNNLIENKESAFERLTMCLNNKIPSDTFSFTFLIEMGYPDYFKELVFGNRFLVNKFEWGNKNLEPVTHYIKYRDLDEQIVKSLCTAFGGLYYPRDMCKHLKKFFSLNEEKRVQFIKIAEQINERLPKDLGF
ncbi:hypothetical protein ACE106_17490 [Shouchella clausii]|uniref:hypothetical protein n=2 Tax=Shouchella clausii TaxID=79880 RepID=UPI0035BFAB30